MQETGRESPVDDEPAERRGGCEVLVEMKRIAVAAEIGKSRNVLSGDDVPPPAVPLAMLDLKPLAVPGAEAF